VRGFGELVYWQKHDVSQGFPWLLARECKRGAMVRERFRPVTARRRSRRANGAG
jgi:hypothetical protein